MTSREKELLQQALEMIEEQELHIAAEMLPAGRVLVEEIKAALSQQAESECPVCCSDEPHTGTCGSSNPRALCNRAKAEPAPTSQCEGCQAGFPVDEKGYHRMGRSGIYADIMRCEKSRYVSEPAPAQDEREAFIAAAKHHKVEGIGFNLEATSSGSFRDNETRMLHEGWKLARATRTSLTEQQPVGRVLTHEENLRSDGKSGPAFWFGPLPAGAFLYAAPIAQTEQENDHG